MSTELERFLQDRENRSLFEQERLILDITETICGLMNDQGINRAEMARRLGCSPSNITQMLDGDNNFTVGRVAALLFELGMRLRVSVEPVETAASDHPAEAEAASKPVVEMKDFGYQPRLMANYYYSQNTPVLTQGSYSEAA